MQQFPLTSGCTVFQCTPHSRKTSYIVCLWQLLLELSLPTLVVQPRRHKRVPGYFTCACSKQADQSVVESILIPQRARSFWSALQIATSARTGFSKHEQSICFAFLANHICQIWQEAGGISAHAQIILYGQKLSFLMLTRESAFVRGSSSETQGLSAGTMRYSRAKVYFKRWRAPGNLVLPNQLQKWSNSVPLLGRKFFFSAQSTRSSSRVTLSFSYTKQFSSWIDLVAWPSQREGCRGQLKKKQQQQQQNIQRSRGNCKP